MIRPATAADVEAVADLERENLGADAWSPALVGEGIMGGLPTIRYLVAELDGQIAGYAAASIVAEVAELQRIAVTPALRRTGLATALLDGVVAAARDGGAEGLLLEVREDNTGAVAFYAAAGFTEIARRRRYYRDGATAVVMQLPVS